MHASIDHQSVKPATLARHRFAVSDAGLEWIKWLAFIAMLLDHINWFWFAAGGNPQHSAYAWMNDVGRLAMPLFCFAFGSNLARIFYSPNRQQRLHRMSWRLGLSAVIAQPAYWVLRDYLIPLNVLALFGLAVTAAVIWHLDHKISSRAAAIALILIGGFFVEYWWFGLAMVFAAWGHRHSQTWIAFAGFVLATSLLALVSNNVFVLVPVLILIAFSGAHVAPKRFPGLLYVLYPLHLWAIVITMLILNKIS